MQKPKTAVTPSIRAHFSIRAGVLAKLRPLFAELSSWPRCTSCRSAAVTGGPLTASEIFFVVSRQHRPIRTPRETPRRDAVPMRAVHRSILHRKNSGLPHTIPMKLSGTCGSVSVRLIPAPRGTGLVAAPASKKILAMAGLEDCYSTTRGHSRTTGNFITAVFNAVSASYGSVHKSNHVGEKKKKSENHWSMLRTGTATSRPSSGSRRSSARLRSRSTPTSSPRRPNRPRPTRLIRPVTNTDVLQVGGGPPP